MRRSLDDQYKRDRETLDRMLDLFSRSPTSISNGGSSSKSDEDTHLSIPERIYLYIQQVDGNFTKQQLNKFIEEKAPKFSKGLSAQALSGALWKLSKDQKIKIVIPKKGIAGAIYAKVDASQAK